jgi:ABC-type multidrug transport system fused ATPase/permease subunit
MTLAESNLNGASPPQQAYQQRAEAFDCQRHHLEGQAYWVSWGRVASMLAAAGCLTLGWPEGGPARLWFVATGLLSILFLVLVSWSGRLRKQEDRFAGLSTINRHALARLKRQWGLFPVPAVDLPAEAETVSRDLDLFGHASLYQLVCTAHTSLGRQRLRDWLIHPANPDTISGRQAAVARLAPELELRQEMELLGQQAAKGHANVSKFVDWAESESWLEQHRWLVGAARILPVGILVLLVLGVYQIVPGSLWLLPVILGMVISMIYCRKIHSIFHLISSRRDEIRSYSDLFRLATRLPGTCRQLERLQQQLPSGNAAPYRRLALLGRIMDLANFRYSPMVYMFVQPLTMWDFHVLWLAEAWQRRTGGQVRGWFAALADLEAFASLASLAHDHPDWSMPRLVSFDDSQQARSPSDELRARGLGHPLLPEDTRVVNDVTVGPAGTVLLVTGSNMSGKSTLLRALGTNVALAQAGGPVCADHLAMPPVVLATSMRIDDSLEQGVSFFMAELKRLKEIVDLAVRYGSTARGTRPNKMVLYLLDEILLGTNSAERHIAVERVLGHLLRQGAIGAITSHDLELANSPVLKGACQTVHFRESFVSENGNQRMKFDYHLHPGVATTRNALKLLEMVGLAKSVDYR